MDSAVLQRWAVRIAFLTIAVGATTVIGWLLNIPILNSLLPGFTPMKFNTGLSFILAGAALALHHDTDRSPYLRTAAIICATLLGGLAALNLGQYLLNIDLGIDQWLVRDLSGTVPIAGRMSLASAANFLLVSIVLLLHLTGRLRWLQPYICGAIAFISYVALLGFVYGMESLHSVFLYSQIALYTSIVFVLLALGLLLVQTDLPLWKWLLTESESGRYTRRLLLLTLILPILLGGAVIVFTELRPINVVVSVALLVVLVSILFLIAVGWNGYVLYTRDQTRRAEDEAQLALSMEKERAALLKGFLQTASHDLRIPLTTIATSAYLMSRTENTDQRAQRLELIVSQIDHVSAILDEFSKIAELAAQDRILHPSIAINRLVRNVAERVKQPIEAHGLRLETDFAPDGTIILGSESELMNAFMQIVDNAMRFTPQGGTITIRTKLVEQFVIEIYDTGIGIRAEDLPHIFEWYFKADEARTMDGSRAGLGLAIVKRVIELHQGRIEVESTVGQGSVFRIYLPLAPQT